MKMSFRDMSVEVQYRAPATELERVLHEYSWANSDQVLDIVLGNWRLLRKADLLEKAFIDAWTMQKWVAPHWRPVYNLRAVFPMLDRAKLLRAGDPLPDGDSFTVYRGVAGKRRVRGYSRTGDLDVAKHFAKLRAYWGLPNPAVYSAIISRQHVLAYIDASGRNEKEFLVVPRNLSNLKLLVSGSRIPAEGEVQ